MITFNTIDVRINSEEYLFSPELQEKSRIRKDRESELLLKDLKMLGTGNIFSTRQKKVKDFDIASGIANLAQATTHRLITIRGHHPEDPSVGIPWLDYLGQTYASREEIISSLETEIDNEISRDSRVSSVSVELNFIDTNTLSADIRIENISGEYALISVGEIRGEPS